jgi:hypothetical protein
MVASRACVPPSDKETITPGLFQDGFAPSSKWFHLWLFGQISCPVLASLADNSGSAEAAARSPGSPIGRKQKLKQ